MAGLRVRLYFCSGVELDIGVSMEIPEFTYMDRSSLHTTEDVVKEMNRVLLHVEKVAFTLTDHDMLDETSRKWFIKHTGWIRMLYARLEEILFAEEEAKREAS